jgi:hypothetical protein
MNDSAYAVVNVVNRHETEVIRPWLRPVVLPGSEVYEVNGETTVG